MQTEKLAISLPTGLVRFIEEYQRTHHHESCSLVVQEALALLRERELERAYRQAGQEQDDAWDATAGDGLKDEAW